MTTDGKYLISVYTKFGPDGNTIAWTPDWNKPRCKKVVADRIINIITESLNSAPLESRMKEHESHEAYLNWFGYMPPGDPDNASITFGVHKKAIYTHRCDGFEDAKKLAIDRVFEYIESGVKV